MKRNVIRSNSTRSKNMNGPRRVEKMEIIVKPSSQKYTVSRSLRS